MKRPLIIVTAMAASFGTMLTATPALAENVAIEYRDLNLSTEQGQEALALRIKVAAKKVCGVDQHGMGSRIRDAETKRCFEKAKKQATKQMAAIVDDKRLGG